MTFGPPEPFRLSPDEIVISEKEYVRYLGMKNPPEGDLSPLFDECVRGVKDALSVRGVMRTCRISVRPSGVDFGFAKADSASLAKNLADCNLAVLFAVTAGPAVDRLIAKYSASSPAKALVADAVASAAVEGAAAAVSAELKKRYGKVRPRFSPGFGDLPLSFERDLLSFVDGARRAGITLTGSLLLVPVKSVTAVQGITEV
ncbi:MAG: Vitamin B12 dependent methionine synthase activation subunit [Clostridia bacterium]|nr:Vitamin B12 dependent methionine synthase activation subunit [Clostridia bacterium]